MDFGNNDKKDIMIRQSIYESNLEVEDEFQIYDEEQKNEKEDYHERLIEDFIVIGPDLNNLDIMEIK